jgi:uncharacterized LabA/DUF88 family protein
MAQSEERVLCLVDAQRIWNYPLETYRAKVDFARLMTQILDGRQLFKAIAYLVADPVKDQTAFLRKIKKFGYQNKLKAAYWEGGIFRNTDWQEKIARDALRYADRYDVLVLVTSDDRFLPLIDQLISAGKRVEVCGWSEDLSGPLCVRASDFRLSRRIVPDAKRPRKSFEWVVRK